MIRRILAGVGLTLVFVMALVAAMSGAMAQMRGAPAGPTEVGVITLTTEQVPYTVTLPGRAVAWQSADIRPRVGGVVAEILYEPGRAVTTGQVMFQIEDATYRAALQAAEAGQRQAEAAVATAEAALARARTLVGVGTTQASVEVAELALAQAQAGLSSAEAARQIAQLDLDQTRLRSPIDGIADLPQITIGAIVTANQAAALTTVTRIDPIYVDVAESSAAMMRNRDRLRAGGLAPGEGVGVRLTLEDGRVHDGMGRMVSRGSAVSTTTGTAMFRFAFDNPEGLILPGQFLRVQVTLGMRQAVLVPQRATSRAADGRLTAWLVRDGRAVQVTLTEDGVAQNAWVVTAGAEAGDLVIVDGLQNLRDGAEVAAVPVTISDDGVVQDVVAEGAGDGAVTPARNGTAPADGPSPDGAPAAGGQGRDARQDAPAAGNDATPAQVAHDATGQPAADAGADGAASTSPAGRAGPGDGAPDEPAQAGAAQDGSASGSAGQNDATQDNSAAPAGAASGAAGQGDAVADSAEREDTATDDGEPGDAARNDAARNDTAPGDAVGADPAPAPDAAPAPVPPPTPARNPQTGG